MKTEGGCVDVPDKKEADMVGSSPNVMRNYRKVKSRKTVRRKVPVQIAVYEHNIEGFNKIKEFQDFKFSIGGSNRALGRS